MKLLLLSADLMLGARIEGAARKLELSVVTVGSQESALNAIADDVRILVIDLRLPNLPVGPFVESLRQHPTSEVRIVACGPHVHEEKLDAARDAGCDVVATRGQMDSNAEAIFGQLLNA